PRERPADAAQPGRALLRRLGCRPDPGWDAGPSGRRGVDRVRRGGDRAPFPLDHARSHGAGGVRAPRGVSPTAAASAAATGSTKMPIERMAANANTKSASTTTRAIAAPTAPPE